MAVELSRSVKGLTVLVTGAASGMGRATAEVFAAEGANVALTDLLDAPARRAQYGQAGLTFADSADIYSMPERAADVILKEA